MEWVGVYSRLVGPFGGLVVQVFFFLGGGGWMDGNTHRIMEGMGKGMIRIFFMFSCPDHVTCAPSFRRM